MDRTVTGAMSSTNTLNTFVSSALPSLSVALNDTICKPAVAMVKLPVNVDQAPVSTRYLISATPLPASVAPRWNSVAEVTFRGDAPNWGPLRVNVVTGAASSMDTFFLRAVSLLPSLSSAPYRM